LFKFFCSFLVRSRFPFFSVVSLVLSLSLSLSLSIALFLRSGFDRCGCRGWKKQSARACVRFVRAFCARVKKSSALLEKAVDKQSERAVTDLR
jgi:hypothetical protein